MKNDLVELVKFMARFLAKKECLISPNICSNKKGIVTDQLPGEYIFTPDKRVKGVVVFGDRYPLCGLDISIEDHLKVYEVIKSLEPYGLVFTSAGPKGESLQYLPKLTR